MWRFLSAFLILINCAKEICATKNILCSEEFCKSYLEKHECLLTSVACNIQNRTFNGESFPAIVPCNCCSVCLENLNEGDFCTIGSPDALPPLLACGPGLYCARKSNDEHSKCQKMTSTSCFKEQMEYDNLMKENKVQRYTHRPHCDGDGNYNSVKCNLGQTCFCVDEKGQRIFGESVHSKLIELSMKCECSRLAAKLSSSFKFRYPTPLTRCLDDGSFDPLHCVHDECICLEEETGAPTEKIYNITKMRFQDIPCYDKTIHSSYGYLHACERIKFDLLDEISLLEKDDFRTFNAKFPRCQVDGWFDSVGEKDSWKFCRDKYGRNIEGYSVPKNSRDAEEMTCNCARTQQLLKRNRAADLPKCCSNGNFEKVQCRTSTAECYCVDENGLQTSKEEPMENISKLSCYNNGNFC